MSDTADKPSKKTVYLLGPSHNGEHGEKHVVDAERADELVENHLATFENPTAS